MAKKDKASKSKAKTAGRTYESGDPEVARLQAENEDLQEQLSGWRDKANDLEQQLYDLKQESQDRGEREMLEVGPAIYDVACCVGAIRERVTGYPLNDAEFHQIAPDLVRQAVDLAWMIQDEMFAAAERRAALASPQSSEEQEPGEQHPTSPSLP